VKPEKVKRGRKPAAAPRAKKEGGSIDQLRAVLGKLPSPFKAADAAKAMGIDPGRVRYPISVLVKSGELQAEGKTMSRVFFKAAASRPAPATAPATPAKERPTNHAGARAHELVREALDAMSDEFTREELNAELANIPDVKKLPAGAVGSAIVDLRNWQEIELTKAPTPDSPAEYRKL
jgi:hypothetical protein